METEVNGVREVGGLVGGRVVDRLEGEVGGSQKELGSRVGPKKTWCRPTLTPTIALCMFAATVLICLLILLANYCPLPKFIASTHN